jgi:UPF0755 protein
LLQRFLRLLVVIIALGVLVAAAALTVARFTQPTAPAGNAAPAPPGGLDAQLLSLYLTLRGGDINSPAGADSKPVLFVVRPGDTTTVIGQRLQQAGLVRDAELFRLYVRSVGADGRLEAGEFRLNAAMTTTQVADALRHGQAASTTITVREGLRMEEAAEIVSVTLGLRSDAFLFATRTARFGYASLVDRPTGASLEGYLFPDTYQVAASATVTDVVDLLVGTFDQRFTPAMRQQAAKGQQTIFQVVTLASLVEREAQLASERPVIASVYLNRLARGMALEADSTVQYALGYDPQTKKWWRTLTLDDLRRPVGPYSTYLNRGLPPGPLCSPGLASLQAALEPASTGYLYYYAKGDGSHAFATTFEEHQQNMRTYGR